MAQIERVTLAVTRVLSALVLRALGAERRIIACGERKYAIVLSQQKFHRVLDNKERISFII